MAEGVYEAVAARLRLRGVDVRLSRAGEDQALVVWLPDGSLAVWGTDVDGRWSHSRLVGVEGSFVLATVGAADDVTVESDYGVIAAAIAAYPYAEVEQAEIRAEVDRLIRSLREDDSPGSI